MPYELVYTTDDDGVWLVCSHHFRYGKNLGHFATPQDAVEAEKELGVCPRCEKKEEQA